MGSNPVIGFLLEQEIWTQKGAEEGQCEDKGRTWPSTTSEGTHPLGTLIFDFYLQDIKIKINLCLLKHLIYGTL